jgi:hypothetical protein
LHFGGAEKLMEAFWWFLTIAIVVIVGNLLTLKRTAHKPKIPGSVKPLPPSEDDDDGW